MRAAPLLRVDGVTVAFGGLKAINELRMDVAEGSIHALIGPNGAGKSTAVNAMTGFVRISGGSLRLGDRDLTGLSAHRIAASGIARTFQDIRLFRAMTVLENILVGAHGRFRASPATLLLFQRKALAEEAQAVSEARALLDFVGLGQDVAGRFAATLSYGHQRRVEIARSLISRPRLLLLDEPLAGMNAAEKDEVAELVRRIRDGGTTILLIEHDMQIVRALADHLTVLNHGRRLADGRPADVFDDAAVQSAYLGRARA